MQRASHLLKERQPDATLQRLHLQRYAWLAQIQRGGRSRIAAMLGNRAEDMKLVEVNVHKFFLMRNMKNRYWILYTRPGMLFASHPQQTGNGACHYTKEGLRGATCMSTLLRDHVSDGQG